MQDAQNRLWRLLFSLTDRMKDFRNFEYSPIELESAFSLTINQTRVIRAVWELEEKRGGEVTLKLLSEYLRITAAAASEMVENLVQKGVLKREQSRSDRRAISLGLSDAAKVFLQRRWDDFDRISREFLESIEPEEGKLLVALLERFQKKLRAEEESLARQQ